MKLKKKVVFSFIISIILACGIISVIGYNVASSGFVALKAESDTATAEELVATIDQGPW